MTQWPPAESLAPLAALSSSPSCYTGNLIPRATLPRGRGLGADDTARPHEWIGAVTVLTHEVGSLGRIRSECSLSLWGRAREDLDKKLISKQ